MKTTLHQRLEAMAAEDLRGLVAAIWHDLFPTGDQDDVPSGADFIDAVGLRFERARLLPTQLRTRGRKK